jgi:hypothetical protein
MSPVKPYLLTADEAEIVARVCELLVPGSASVGPAVYVDAAAADWPEEQQMQLRAAIAALAPVREEGEAFLARHEGEPEFALMRALAIDGYYSDFAQPGYEGPTAWDDIEFNSEQARRLQKDWSYMRCFR